MPSRFTNRSTALVGLVALLSMQIAAPASGQQLTLPSDMSGGMLTPSGHSGTNGNGAVLTQGTMPPLGPDATMVDAGPMSAMSSGQYYNPTLGSHIRARFNTRSYGQQQDTLDLGTMKLMELDGGIAFLDGQVTMNDVSGVGYNLGVGYRWMTLPLFPWSPDDEKIMGVSVWSDGQTVGQENFFSQVGVSLEFLGDHLDFRANGYAPVGSRSKTRDFVENGELTFTDHFVAPELLGVRDTALTVGEAELAGRLGDLDAWAFAGIYGFAGGGYDAVGGKLGLRGYATPDLLLSVAVANDDQFDTNALFSATWFIGRTRAENCPTGVLSDRMREPVIRNDYIATEQSTAFGAGDPLLGTDGELVRLTHVNSGAAAGGDGSFENPLNDLGDINSMSLDEDIVYAHSGGDFNDQTARLRDGQTFYGEGNDNPLQATFLNRGTFDLPESSPGAASGPVATIDGGAGAGVILADNNVVQNLDFDGGLNAIINDTTLGSTDPTLRDLTITGTTGDGIALTTVVDDDPDTTDTTDTVNIMGTVTIEDIAFNNVGGRDIFIDADATGADVNSGETINIARVTSTGNTGGPSIDIHNTNAATVGSGTTTITDYTYTGGVGGLLLTNTGSNVLVTESDFTGGTGPAVRVEGSQSTSTITVGSTNTITDIAGDAVVINANEGVVSVDADIATASTVDGGTIRITSNEGAVNARGNLQANNRNLVTILNAKGDINIGSAFDAGTGDGTLVHTGTGTAISITDDTTDPDTSSVVGITINGNLDNDGGQSVVVDGGNDDIQFTGDLDDSAEGIAISNLSAQEVGNADSSRVRFGPNVILNTGTNDAVVLSGNNAESMVEFQDLDITTTSGNGLVSDGGELNVDKLGIVTTTGDGLVSSGDLTVNELDIVTTTGDGLISNGGVLNVGDDGTGANPASDSTITTDSGQAIAISGGSSTNGVNLASVNTSTPTNAVVVSDFGGRVTINGGTINATGQAVSFTDAEFALNDVTINGAPGNTLQASFTDGTNRTVSLNNVEVSGGNVALTSTAASTGNTVATVTDITGGDVAIYNSQGSGTNQLTITDSAFTGGYDFDATGTSSLAVTMNTDDGTLTGGPVNFSSTGSGGSSLDIDNLTSTGGFAYNSSGAGTLDVDMNNVVGSGIVGFNSDGTGNNTLDITDADTGGAFSYNVMDSGDLAVTMTRVTGNGNVVLGIIDEGNGSLVMDTVDTGGTLAVTGSAASTGNLTVNATDSGNTTAFTSVTVNQEGTGSALATFNNTESDTGIDFDSASDTLSSLSVTGGDYGGGAIAFDETGGGDATVSLTNVTNAAGVTVNEAGDGNVSLTMNGGSYAGAIVLNEAGAGNASANLSGGVTSTGGFTMNEAGDGDSSLTMNNATFGGDILFDELGSGSATSSLTNVTTTGLLNFDTAGAGNGSLTVNGGSYGGAITANAAASTAGDFTASVDGVTFTSDSRIVFDGQNTGNVTYQVNNIAGGFNTIGDQTAIDLTVGSNVNLANVSVTANTGIQTGDNHALALTLGANDVNFLLNGNTFSNNSGALETVLITNNNGTTLNSTIQNNNLNNTGVGDALLLLNQNGASNNLLVDANEPAGSQYIFTNDGTMRVRGDSAAAVDGTNDGDIMFNGLNAPTFDNNLNVPTP